MIEVGEYVRDKEGYIFKVEEKIYDEDWKDYFLKGDSVCSGEWEDSVIKHSKNIIDLIEVGDYVNGKKVNSVSQGYVYEEFDFDTATAICSEDDIKSIVTHEQFAQMEYRIGE